MTEDQRIKAIQTAVGGLSLEDGIEYGKMGAKASEETKTGIYALTTEQSGENAKKQIRKDGFV